MNTYRIAAAARLSGLSIETIRAWERRYKIVLPARDEKGVRRYSQAQIERLKLLRAAVTRGQRPGDLAGLSDEELQRQLGGKKMTHKPSRSRGRHFVTQFLSAVAQYDLIAAEGQLSSAALLLSPLDLITQVLLPTLREVGVRWESGLMSVGQEHFASNIIRTMIASLSRLRGPVSSDAIVFFTPEGELHEFGIQLAACVAALQGFRPVVLGPSVPAADVVHTACATAARTVVGGIVATTELDRRFFQIKEIRRRLPAHTNFIIGGSGALRIARKGVSGIHAVSALEDFADGAAAWI